MLNITINLWVLRNKNYDGIGYYSINLFKELIKQNPQINFQLLLPSNYAEDFFNFKNVKNYKIFPPLRHPVLYILWLEIIVPIIMLFIKTDLLISGDGMLSILSLKKQVPIFYDLNFRHFPKVMDFKNRIFYNTMFPLYARKAIKIATISEFCKKDIITEFNLPESKVFNIYGNSHINSDILKTINKEKVKEKFSNSKDYFFFVGSLLPRKNLIRLVQSFDLFKNKNKSDIKLLISGRISWGNKELNQIVNLLKFKDDIIFCGRLSDTELTEVMTSSIALCYVSLFEGFGMPIVEAMRCGVPIITSNITSMPEIASDSAIIINPYSIDEIADAMNQIYLNKDNLRENLISKGYKRANDFSWENSAKLLSEKL